MRKVTAIVDREKCRPSECNKQCIQYDPINRSGGEGFHIGKESGKSEVDENIITEMHKICAKMCPFEAIKIVNLPEQLNQEPIHCYGTNLFRLFNLPTPIFGKVIGLLGVNGIGKSTALKIMAGTLQPNLGKDKEASYDELIDFFKGTEAQLFFEKRKKEEVVVSFKPQQVDLIAKTTKGNVRDLLQKVDEKNMFDEVVEKLQLKNILDNDIGKISGGELQRVCIAAAVMKKANFYIFDEPTSYLDIKQRINVARFIKELADENTAVLVVEHDLIILDYMTDLIHLMYGTEGGFGIVSQPRTTKEGINVYLSGYLKEENIKFRDKEIKFLKRPPEKKDVMIQLTSWKGISKKLGHFKLEAEEGILNKKDVVGVLGENGIGKTSFVKILAGEIEPDKGDIKSNITVSYKPQYIDTNSDELVANVLHEAIIKYDVQIIRPLQIKPLLNRKINELSGGELQRVSIALCLSKKVDLYLLDEPSAYLDVEQRLIISRVIGNIMKERGTSAIVVDHDLLFIDYLSDNLLVFDGEPAINGSAKGPFEMQEGMTKFLEDLGMTFRREPHSNMPRANKEGSVKDREQKNSKNYYYL